MVHWPSKKILGKTNMTKSVVCSKFISKPPWKASVGKKKTVSDMTGNMDRVIVLDLIYRGVCVCDLDLIQSLLAWTCLAGVLVLFRDNQNPCKMIREKLATCPECDKSEWRAKSWGLPYGRGSQRQGQKACFSSPPRTPGCSKKLPI